jgi:hypothetical protein
MQKRIAIGFFTACQKRLSPAASAIFDLGAGKTIKTNYSNSRMKGREIYGGLEPFGQVCRAGANEATAFVTSSDVVVGGNNDSSSNFPSLGSHV